MNFNLYPPLKLADQYLEQSFSVKYLGLIIDCFLSWHEHIYHISGKISKSVNIIAKLKPYVTSQSLISIGNRMNASAFRDLWARVMF